MIQKFDKFDIDEALWSDKVCPNCGTHLSIEHHGNAKYCSTVCRRRFHSRKYNLFLVRAINEIQFLLQAAIPRDIRVLCDFYCKTTSRPAREVLWRVAAILGYAIVFNDLATQEELDALERLRKQLANLFYGGRE